MPQLDRAGLCDITEYQQAYNERLKAGQLTDGQILMVYLRLERMGMAIKSPVQTTTIEHTMGGLVLDVLVLNEDLKAPKGMTPARGALVDGVWNSFDPKECLGYVNEQGKEVASRDGVFGQYDDGLDMNFFEETFAGAGASTGIDLGSFRF